MEAWIQAEKRVSGGEQETEGTLFISWRPVLHPGQALRLYLPPCNLERAAGAPAAGTVPGRQSRNQTAGPTGPQTPTDSYIKEGGVRSRLKERTFRSGAV